MGYASWLLAGLIELLVEPVSASHAPQRRVELRARLPLSEQVVADLLAGGVAALTDRLGVVAVQHDEQREHDCPARTRTRPAPQGGRVPAARAGRRTGGVALVCHRASGVLAGGSRQDLGLCTPVLVVGECP